MLFYDNHIRNKIESFLSFLIGNLMCALVMICVFAKITDPVWGRTQATTIFLYALLAWTVIADGWFVLKMWYGVGNNLQPLAPMIAASQPRLPWIFRPLVGLWWVLHVVLASGLLIAFCFEMGHASWVQIIGMTLLTWGISYLSFSFLLLTVTAFSRNLNAVLWLWKYRGGWAFLISAITFIIEIFQWSKGA